MSTAQYQGITEDRFKEQLEVARYGLIRAQWKLGKWKEALAEAERGIKLAPNNYLHYYMYAVIADGKGVEPEKVYQCALKAVQIQPTHDASRKLYASVCKKQGRFSEVADIQVAP
jgi:tetratricopeptide (TPR) repeat protein